MRSWSLYGPRPRDASAESSRGRPHPLADDRRQLLVAIELAERDLPGGDEAEEQDDGTVLGRQGALRLHLASDLLVEALDHVSGAQRLPLRLLLTGLRLPGMLSHGVFLRRPSGTTAGV